MELPLTVADALGPSPHERDVMVHCEPGSRVGQIATALAATAGPGNGRPGNPAPLTELYLDGLRLDPASTVVAAGVVPGSVVWLGGPGPARRQQPTSLRRQLAVIGGPAAGGVIEAGDGTITVGRSDRCDLVLEDKDASRLHATFTAAEGSVTVEDLHSTNGTTVNGSTILVPTPVAPGDLVGIGGSVLTVRPPPGPPAECEATPDGRLRFNRPPRDAQRAVDATFELPKEPERAAGRHFSVVAIVAPLVLGLAITVISHTPELLLFSLASPLMLGANVISDRRSGRRTYARRLVEYEQARATLSDRLQVAVLEEQRRRRAASPDPAAVASIAGGPTQQLWERRREDPDYLTVRVGLADLPPDITLVGGAAGGAGIQPPPAWAVPCDVGLLGAGVMGVAGTRAAALGLIRAMILQLTVLHSPNDLSLVFLSPLGPEGWDWLKWLPHLIGAGGATRLVGIGADERRARVDELVGLIEERAADRTRRTGTAPGWPTVVVVLDEVTRLRAEPGVAYLLREGPAVGVVALCLATDRSGLPAEVTVYAEILEALDGPSTARLSSAAGVIDDIVADQVSEQHAVTVARAMAPLFEVAPRLAGSLSLPAPPLDHLRLLGLQPPTPEAVLDSWAAPARRPHRPAVLGVSEEGPFTVDPVSDGPHVLIAGTTGAGKSELLQTLVASLALSNGPDALTFLLVDFKGGSAFKDCARLPHTLGVISNLDGRLVERALDSLQAELRWRQARFNEAGAKDYDEHRSIEAGRPGGIPRLVVVVDELKELSDAYGEAITRLNQTARLGRSLGVHLILATQKPALVPGLADLRANTDLRLSLRVQDDTDSRDMIGVTDAATIRRSDVGRAIARMSDGSLVRFQTGYLGTRFVPGDGGRSRPVEVGRFDLSTPPGPAHAAPAPAEEHDGRGVEGVATETSLQALVTAIRSAADRLDLPAPRLPWLEPLPELLTADDSRLGSTAPIPAFPVGLMDLPGEQRQEPLVIDFDDLANLLVVGSSRSGRTTFLRSLAGIAAGRAGPLDVHLYGLEFRRASLGDLEQLPNCGGIIGLDDGERIERFLLFLEGEVQRRSVAMVGFSSLAEQRAAAGPGGSLPYLVVLCDNYEAFHERYAFEDGGRMVDRFGALVSDGPARGIHFVITTDRRGTLSKLPGSIDARLWLRPRDRDDFLSIGWSGRNPPSDLPAGRGFWWRGAAEAQVALLPATRPGASQMEAVAELARRATAGSSGWAPDRLPRRIPVMPERVTEVEGETWRRFPRPGGRSIVTPGVGGVEVTPADIDLEAAGSTFVVAGARGSGRSTALLVMASGLLAGPAPMPLIVVTPRRSPMRALAGHSGVQVLASLDTLAGDLGDALGAVSGPLALVIDDAELLLDTPASSRLDRIMRTASDNEWLVLLGGTTSDLLRRFSGWIFDARQSRSGIILQPASAADGELLDLRLPRTVGAGPPAPPGRGILAERGRWMTIQVFVPAGS